MGTTERFASNGSQAEGYLAVPASGSGPGVLVIQEWWGLVPHIRDVCDRFASEGFVALAPDLYHGASTTEPDEAGKLMMGLSIDRAAKDMSGAVDFLGRSCAGPVSLQLFQQRMTKADGFWGIGRDDNPHADAGQVEQPLSKAIW